MLCDGEYIILLAIVLYREYILCSTAGNRGVYMCCAGSITYVLLLAIGGMCCSYVVLLAIGGMGCKN